MKKKKIIHVIDSLGRGGAETMLVNLLPDLSAEYELTLVTLKPDLEFEKKQIVCHEYISLNYSGGISLLSTVKKMRRIIRQIKPDMVRCQLYWSTIVGRLACPKEIPFIFSVHATMNEDPIVFYKRFFLYLLERLTYRRNQHMIGVTEAVVNSFKAVHPAHGETILLHNFVRDEFFQQDYVPSYHQLSLLKLVCVSNIRLIKNIPYLVEAMKLLQGKNILLDIYGDGPLKKEIENIIQTYSLNNVKLMGKHANICNILPNYNVFVSSSTVEGFGIAVAEAMSVGLPVIVSDIPVYREICEDKAIYLDNQDPQSLQNIVLNIMNGKIDLQEMSINNRIFARKKFSKQGYLFNLKKIYQEKLH